MRSRPQIYLDNSDEELEQTQCILCQRQIFCSKYPSIIERALERKYCSNLTSYYFIRSIARILKQER